MTDKSRPNGVIVLGILVICIIQDDFLPSTEYMVEEDIELAEFVAVQV